MITFPLLRRAMQVLPALALLAISQADNAFGAAGDPPLANAGPDNTVTANSSNAATVTLDGSATIGFDGLITYTWEEIPSSGIPVLLASGVGLANPSVTLTGLGDHYIRLTASDDYGPSEDFVTITLVTGGCNIQLTQPAANQTVECDGMGDNDALEAWLDNNGGATATTTNGPITWTSDYNQSHWVYPDCHCAHGYVVVIFTATDAAGCAVSTTAQFKVVDTTAPTLTWKLDGVVVGDAATYSVQQKDLPVVIDVIPSDLCGGATLTKHTYQTIDGCVGVSYCAQRFTITSGTVGATIKLKAQATDDCGNVSACEYICIDVISNGKGNCKAKGNEGLGNGPDGNTPGHYHNGGNDDPQYSPGNPGARNKRR